MVKICLIKHKDFQRFKNFKISNIDHKTVLFAICDKCGSNNGKIFIEKEYIKILNILDLNNNING